MIFFYYLAMPQPKEIDWNALTEAIKKCLVEEQSLRSIAGQFSIPKTTLNRYVVKVKHEFADIEAAGDDRLLSFVRECGVRVPGNQVS